MAEQTQKDYDALRKDMDALRKDLAALKTTVSDEAESRLERAKVKARETGERLQTQAQQLNETVTGQVQERPLTALFSAFGIGMVLGTLLGRKG